MTTPFEELLEELLRSDAFSVGARLHEFSHLAAEGAAALAEIWPSIPDPVRRTLVTRLVELAEADFEMDFGSVFRLGLQDEDADVRRAAIDGLWEDEDVRLVPLLVARLLEDAATGVRCAAATSLGRFVLLGELQKIRPRVYQAAYDALWRCYLTNAEASDVQRRALESLSYVDSDDVARLIEQAYAAPHEKTRVSAVFAMGRSASHRWDSQVRQELFSPNPEMRYEGARACGEIGIDEAVPELEELADDVDPEVQEAALWALGQIGGSRARQVLERYALSENEAAREAAEAALAEFEFLHGDLADLFDRLIEEDD